MQKSLTWILLILVSSAYANDKRIIIAADNWCPLTCAESDINQGYLIDVATAAFAVSGYTVKYVEMPWTRAIGLARKGELHAIAGAFADDAPDFHFPQFPLITVTNQFFVQKDVDWQYDSLRSLNDIRLGVIKGYDYGETLNNYIRSEENADASNVHLMFGNDAVERSIRFLLKGRIQAFVETGPVFWYSAKKMGVADQLKLAGNIGTPEATYIAFSPKLEQSLRLALLLDKGVILLKEQNQLSVIAEKYGIPKDLL